jgi:hypothetical protein
MFLLHVELLTGFKDGFVCNITVCELHSTQASIVEEDAALNVS